MMLVELRFLSQFIAPSIQMTTTMKAKSVGLIPRPGLIGICNHVQRNTHSSFHHHILQTKGRKIPGNVTSSYFRLFFTTSKFRTQPEDGKSKVKTPQANPSPVSREPAEVNPTSAAKLGVKDLLKKYGIPFAVWYSSLYFGGIATLYILFESGIFGENAVIDLIKMTPLENYVDLSKIDSKHGNLGAAVVVNELMEVIRLPFAILTIPYITEALDKRREKRNPPTKS